MVELRSIRPRGPSAAALLERQVIARDRLSEVDDCPMTEDCPGYDRERGTCLLRPDDCEFAPGGGDAALPIETPEALTPSAST